MLKGAGFGISSILALSLTFLVNSYSLAEEQQGKQETQEIKQEKSLSEKVKDAVGVQEAYAMPMPVPLPQNAVVQAYNIKPFLNYANQPVNSKFSKKNFARDEFEKIPIYKGYYFVKDKGDKIEEKVTEGINKSKWKDRIEIDKISTKFSDDDLKLQVKIKENKKRPKSIFGKMLQITVGRVDKIVGRVDYGGDRVELKAVNEF